MNQKIACIDLGSNSFLLCIAEPDATHHFKLLHDHAEIVGLVKNLDSNSCVSSEALARAKTCLGRYREIIVAYDVTDVYAVATASLRRPKNANAVKQQLESVLGYPIEIISGEREAELSFLSVRLDPVCPKGSKIVFDIGGASTEIICGDDKEIERLISIPIGSVLLTEKFGLDQPGSYFEALDFMRSTLRQLKFLNEKKSQGIGVAGTVTSLLASELKLEVYDRAKVHGQTLSFEKLRNWIEKVSNMGLEERKQIVGLTPKRADVFLGGLIIIFSLMEHFDWKTFSCFDSGVRFGLLYEKLLYEKI